MRAAARRRPRSGPSGGSGRSGAWWRPSSGSGCCRTPGPCGTRDRPLARRENLAAAVGRTAVLDGVPDGDLAPLDHVGAQAAAVRQAAQDAEIAGQPDERHARLAQLHAHGLDAAHPEAPADQGVHVDPARRHVAAALSGRELDPGLRRQRLDRLRGDQREIVPLAALVRLAVVVALDPVTGDHGHPLRGGGSGAACGGDVDGLDDAYVCADAIGSPRTSPSAASAVSTPARSTSRWVTARMRPGPMALISTPRSASPRNTPSRSSTVKITMFVSTVAASMRAPGSWAMPSVSRRAFAWSSPSRSTLCSSA